MSEHLIVGIDVAHYQSPADYAAILPAMDFALAKATEGTAWDARFSLHVDYFVAHAVPIVGAYCFGRGDVDLERQLDAFIARAIRPGVSAFALDDEGDHRLSPAQRKWFMAEFRRRTGEKIGKYASESVFTDDGQDWDWVANYDREPRIHYDVWQFGRAAANVDGDRAVISLAELRAVITQEDPVRTFTITGQEKVGSLVVSGTGHSFLRLSDNTLQGPIDPAKFGAHAAIGPVTLVGGGITGPTDKRTTGYLVGTEAAFLLASDVVFTPLPTVDCTQAVKDARAAEHEADRTRAIELAGLL